MAIILNIAHGMAPTNWGLMIATKTRQPIIVPRISDGQEAMIRQNFPEHMGRIYLDEELGRIISASHFKGDFPRHLEKIIEQSGELQKAAREHIKGFEATSNAGPKSFKQGELVELNIGSELSYGLNAVSAFCHVNSRILDLTILLEKGLGYNKDKMKRAADVLRGRESGQCITRFYSMAGIKMQGEEVGFLEGKTQPKNLERGIYVSVSGTGVGTEKLFEHAANLAQENNLVVYHPKTEMKLNPEIFREMPPAQAIGSPEILYVLHRGGIGTAQKCIVNGTPQLILPYQAYDHPEAYWQNQAQLIAGTAMEYRENLLPNTDAQRKRLAEIQFEDGIAQVAAKLR